MSERKSNQRGNRQNINDGYQQGPYSQGGYSQKLEAAKLAGATSLVIGRPEQESGLSLEETIEAWSRWKEHQPEDGKQDEKGQANQQEGADT